MDANGMECKPALIRCVDELVHGVINFKLRTRSIVKSEAEIVRIAVK